MKKINVIPTNLVAVTTNVTMGIAARRPVRSVPQHPNVAMDSDAIRANAGPKEAAVSKRNPATMMTIAVVNI